MTRVKEGVIADNYKELETMKELYNLYAISDREQQAATKIWRGALKQGQTHLGYLIFMKIIEICPEMIDDFPFGNSPQKSMETAVK